MPFKDSAVAQEKHKERSAKRYKLLKADPAAYAAELAKDRNRRKSPERQKQMQEAKRKAAVTEKYKEQAKKSQRRVRLKSRGLTEEGYAAMLLAQGGRCAICRTDKPARNGGNYSFPVDHCHKTGKNRGLLCHACNVTIGRFGDDALTLAEWVDKAVEYLEAAEDAIANTAAVELEVLICSA